LDEATIKVNEDHILATFGYLMIESDWTQFAGIGMTQAFHNGPINLRRIGALFGTNL